VEGRVLWDPKLPALSVDERRVACDDIARVIAALHRVDIAKVGLSDYGKHGDYIERQLGRWTKQYRASETEPIEAMDRLIDWLPAHVPPSGGTSVVHGDYRLDNLVFHKTEPRVLAVLDWELSTLGDPLADFAYYCMAWQLAPPFRGFADLDDEQLVQRGLPTERQALARYVERRGIAPVDPAAWSFYKAFNLFRACAIAQGIMGRALAGNASSAHALEAGAFAKQLAAIGWRQATDRDRP
jgi:aminoglycoside phosphotransferase (APT) family kinase protein